MNLRFPVFSLVFLFGSVAVIGQEQAGEAPSTPETPSEKSSAEDGNPRPSKEEIAQDWLENYYKNPTPDRFVAEMKAWARDGTLDDRYARPALIAFLSQVMRANRDRLEEWEHDLRGLEPEQKQVFNTALLFSRTAEADAILRKQFGERYDREKTEVDKILEMPLDAEPTLNMLWGFYYATGSANAIRRLVLCFRFVEAPVDPGGVEVPRGYVPYYKMLPSMAYDSLVANARRHPRVVAILKTFLEKDESLIGIEKQAVYDILSEVLPEDFPPVEREEVESAETGEPVSGV